MSSETLQVQTFRTLPLGSRIYVALVVLAGAACVLVSATDLHFDWAVLFSVLLGLAVLTKAPEERA